MIMLRWQLDPVLLGVLVTLALVYTLMTGPLRQRLAPGAGYPWRQAFIFYGGVVILYLAEGSPLHDLAESYLLTAHMFQHLIISYIVAPLLIIGSPVYVLRPMVASRRMLPIMRVLLYPAVAFLLFNLFLSMWHFPVIYEGALQNPTLHHFEHVIFLFFSLLLWWPLLSPLKEIPRLPYPGQLMYIFMIPVLQLFVFAIITFADVVLYDTYANAPRIYEWLTPLGDQVLSGAFMKFSSFIIFASVFIVTFLRWYEEDLKHHGKRTKRQAVKS